MVFFNPMAGMQVASGKFSMSTCEAKIVAASQNYQVLSGEDLPGEGGDL
jgi:hypothetical protein